MTETDKLKRAKMYMEMLAQGINPLDGMPVSDEDVVNNSRMSRCFTYVAEVLGQVIEKGTSNPPVPVRKSELTFSLSDEEKALLIPSSEPVSTRDMTEKINALKGDEYPARIKLTAISKWLLEIGMLTTVLKSNGKNQKVPTEEGSALGIFTEERNSIYGGPYLAVLYKAEAQQFIYDNIDAILSTGYSIGKNRATPENAGKPWTTVQDELLRDLVKNGASVKEIAVSLQRNENGVRRRMQILGI